MENPSQEKTNFTSKYIIINIINNADLMENKFYNYKIIYSEMQAMLKLYVVIFKIL